MCRLICSFISRRRRPSSLRASRSASVLRLADRLADLVRLSRELFDLGLQLAALRFELDEPGDVGLHAAVVAVVLNEFGIFENEIGVSSMRL